MEDRLSRPLPLLPLDPENSETASVDSVLSSNGPWTTPRRPKDETQIVIGWQAAAILNRIDTDVLIHKVPKLAGQFHEIEHVPVIKSYMNLLLLLQEKGTEKQWITRIPYHQSDREFLTEEVEPLMRVKKKFKFRVPYLYHYGLAKDPNNDLGVDFMLLDFIDGDQMKMWTETFPAWGQKLQVLEQIADVYIEMFSKPVTYQDRLVLKNANNDLEGMQQDFNDFEIPPTITASLWYHRLADKAIRGKIERLLAEDDAERTEEMHTTMEARLQDLLTLLLMRSLIPTITVGKYNDSPFYITHPDLHNRNIILEGYQVEEANIPGCWRHVWTGQDPDIQGRSSRRLVRSPGRDKLKLAGIVDWDAAHPLPLQAAAIWPKFLETLPGAEFPDLPSDYEASDMTAEKDAFLEILRAKEVERTGCTIVSDLISHGSWERDFLTVALRRGDVRIKWWQWWKGQQVYTHNKHIFVQHELRLDDVHLMRTGLCGFLKHAENNRVIQQCQGQTLIWKILYELDRLEILAIESCWLPYAERWLTEEAPVSPALKVNLKWWITSEENRHPMPGAWPASDCGSEEFELEKQVPLEADNSIRFMLGPEDEDTDDELETIEDTNSALLYAYHLKNPIGG